MIHGIIAPDRVAIIPLTVHGPDGREEELEAVIDTGFNEFLTLPPETITRLGLVFRAPTQATLADGSVISMNNYRGAVTWNAALRNVPVLEADSDPVVGMGLLYGSRVTLEVVDGGAVTIEPLP